MESINTSKPSAGGIPIGSTKGWNWGQYKLGDEHFNFSVNGQPCFVINYKDIALTNASGKNELALEFQQETPESKTEKGDILTEIRFYVPNTEQAQANGNEEEKVKEKKPAKGKGSQASQDEEEDEEEEEEQISPAKVLNEKIIKAAGIGQSAGEMIATLPELPMLIPRGKYSFDLYSDFAKLHGRTNDYKILYKDINKCFLLPKPDGIYMAYLLQLRTPLRQGQTLHHFIALQFEKEKTQKVLINLTKEQISEKYDDKIDQEIEGPLYEVLSKLFKNLAKVNILIPGEFKSFRNEEAVKCSVKASDGYLYPLKSSLVFIHKPVHYIKHQEIKYVEFSRIGGLGAGMPASRSFDMTVTKMDGEAVHFAGIDKQEHKNLMAYLKNKGLKMRTVDPDTNRAIDMQSDGEEEEEESEHKGGKPAKRGGAGAADEYDDEDDDESFKEEGEGGSDAEEDDDEEGGEDQEDAGSDDDSDEPMDAEVDKDELKAIQKEAGVTAADAATKRTRGGARAAATVAAQRTREELQSEGAKKKK